LRPALPPNIRCSGPGDSPATELYGWLAYFPFQSIQLIIERSVDLIVQPGYLFTWTNAGGSIGLVQGKKMVCLAANFE
jgi:hypothetical protein